MSIETVHKIAHDVEDALCNSGIIQEHLQESFRNMLVNVLENVYKIGVSDGMFRTHELYKEVLKSGT